MLYLQGLGLHDTRELGVAGIPEPGVQAVAVQVVVHHGRLGGASVPGHRARMSAGGVHPEGRKQK